MARRFAAPVLLVVLSLVGLLVCIGCASQQGAGGDAVSRCTRARVLSVNDGELAAEVLILEPPGDSSVAWGTFAKGEEGQADFSGWGGR